MIIVVVVVVDAYSMFVVVERTDKHLNRKRQNTNHKSARLAAAPGLNKRMVACGSSLTLSS